MVYKKGEKDYKTDEILYETVDIISVIEANNQYFDYEIAYNSQGKPYFLSNCEIFFNISHSSNYVACVIGDRPVGIDIEKPVKVDKIWQNASLTYQKQNGLKSVIVTKDSSEYGHLKRHMARLQAKVCLTF